MNISKLLNKYNKNNTFKLEEFIYLLSKEIEQPINKGVAYWFCKDIKRQNENIRPLKVKYDNNELYFINKDNNNLFKIIEEDYERFNSNDSALRCRLDPVLKDTSKLFMLSNNKFLVGSNGLYEDYSKDNTFFNYRYLAIKNNKHVEYEAFIDKKNGRMQKDYYSKNQELIGRFIYEFSPRDFSVKELNRARNRITRFLDEEYAFLGKDDYQRMYLDLADQFFYDINLVSKTEKYEDLYITNGTKYIMNCRDKYLLDGISIKKETRKNKENYLALTNPKVEDIKLLCVTDFVNENRINKSYSKYITLELENWFKHLDYEILQNEKELVYSLKNKLKTLNNSITKDYLAIKNKVDIKDRKRFMGFAMGLALITSDNTYIVNYGDTRIYSVKDSILNTLTIDNTLVWDMYKNNRLTKEEAFNYQRGSILTNYLGHPDNYQINPEVINIKNNEYDKLFILSDGVTDNISDDTISTIVLSNKNFELLKEIANCASYKSTKWDDITGCCYIKK